MPSALSTGLESEDEWKVAPLRRLIVKPCPESGTRRGFVEGVEAMMKFEGVCGGLPDLKDEEMEEERRGSATRPRVLSR